MSKNEVLVHCGGKPGVFYIVHKAQRSRKMMRPFLAHQLIIIHPRPTRSGEPRRGNHLFLRTGGGGGAAFISRRRDHSPHPLSLARRAPPGRGCGEWSRRRLYGCDVVAGKRRVWLSETWCTCAAHPFVS